MEGLTGMKCVACRRDAPKVTDAEIKEYHPQVSEWELIERDEIKRLERLFQFDGFAPGDGVCKPCGGTSRGRRSSSCSLDRVGKGHGNLVDAQNPRAASERFHHGGKNGWVVCDSMKEEKNE